MSDTLVIRLSGATPGWVLVDAAGARVAGPGRLGQGELPAGPRRVVLVPTRQVLRTGVDVPVKGTAKVLQALPFALEDQLAEEVDSLQFAAGTREANGRVPVAVVRRDRLTQWLAELADAGINPSAVYADADGLVDVPATTTLLLEPDQLLLRVPGQDPVAAEPAAAGDLLGLWLDQRDALAPEGEVPPPANLLVYVAAAGADAEAESGQRPDTTTEVLAALEALRPRLQSLEIRSLVDGALPRLAAGIAVQPGVNLLQGTYAPRAGFAALWPRWRLAAVLATVAMTTLVGLTALDAWRMRREASALQGTVALALRHTFPDADPGASPASVVAERMAALTGGPSVASGNEFLPTLRLVAEAIGKAGNARLQSLNYRAGVFDLQVQVPSAASLDQIRQQVAADGQRTAEIQSANADGDQVQGRLRIALPAAGGAGADGPDRSGRPGQRS